MLIAFRLGQDEQWEDAKVALGGCFDAQELEDSCLCLWCQVAQKYLKFFGHAEPPRRAGEF